MDDILKDIFDDSNGSDSSTDLDEYDTAEDDCEESYYSLDESSVKNEVLKGEDDYPDIDFIDEDDRNNEDHEIFDKQWSSKTETVLDSDIINYDNSNTNTLKDSNKSSNTGKSSSGELHDSSLQLFDDQRPLSFHEKLSFFEKIGRKTDKVYTKSHDINANALKSHDDMVVDTKQVVNEEDSSDETDGSSAANETSYEDLLESTLETDQTENVSRRSSSGSEGLENLVASFVDNKIVSTDTVEKESGDIEESQVSDSEQFTYLKHGVKSETSSLNKKSICNDSLISAEIPDSDEHTQKDLAKPEMPEKQAGPVEQRVKQLNDLSHQNLFSCTKMVCEAGETREPELARQANSKIVTPKRKNSRCEITAEDLKTLKKTFLLPLRPGEQVTETNELSDHMINRQSSVIKDNHLTEMPFTDYSDSEILNDVKDSQEFKKARVVKSEPAQGAVLRYVELGTASLLEGSHYKNLRCAKIVNPFIPDKKSDLDELKASCDSSVAIENTENTPNIANISRSTDVVLGVTKKEDARFSDVAVSVSDYDCSEKDIDTTEHVESQESELEERDKNRKSGSKSLRRRFWRHKAIVSEYVANIKQAESLRNSGVADDAIRTEAANEEDRVKPDMDMGVFSQENRGSLASKDMGLIVRTVDIGTACLYEIPHLKYLHCARIISPPS